MSMAKGDPDEKLLSYGDVLLRRSDVDLLSGPHWLNDQCISFYFEYLITELHLNQSKSILLIPPATSYLLSSAGPDLSEPLLGPLEFSSKSLVLFPVNNNPDVETVGGSHWSLLVYSNTDSNVELRHYDSSGKSNSAAAQQLAKALGPLLPPGTRVVERALEERCPQQENGYDCGMYVLGIAKILCSRYEKAAQQDSALRDFLITSLDLSASDITTLRSDIHTMILQKINR